MTTLYYLAYGSNLHPLRLQARVDSAQLLGTVQLPGYKLHFHKVGADGSGKCNILASERHSVHAALYSMHTRHKTILDDFEGAGYESVAMQVDFVGARYPAFIYLAEDDYIDDSATPFDWYKQLVLYGAHHHRLPADYVAAIGEVDSVPDPDAKRDSHHADLIRRMLAWD